MSHLLSFLHLDKEHVDEEHAIAYCQANTSKYLLHEMQVLIRQAVKTAPCACFEAQRVCCCLHS